MSGTKPAQSTGRRSSWACEPIYHQCARGALSCRMTAAASVAMTPRCRNHRHAGLRIQFDSGRGWLRFSLPVSIKNRSRSIFEYPFSLYSCVHPGSLSVVGYDSECDAVVFAANSAAGSGSRPTGATHSSAGASDQRSRPRLPVMQLPRSPRPVPAAKTAKPAASQGTAVHRKLSPIIRIHEVDHQSASSACRNLTLRRSRH